MTPPFPNSTNKAGDILHRKILLQKFCWVTQSV